MWNPYITRSNKRRRMTALKATAAVVSCRSDMWSWSSHNYNNRVSVFGLVNQNHDPHIRPAVKFSSRPGRGTRRRDISTLIVTRRRQYAETTDETLPFNPRFSFLSSLVESDLSACAEYLTLPQNPPAGNIVYSFSKFDNTE